MLRAGILAGGAALAGGAISSLAKSGAASMGEESMPGVSSETVKRTALDIFEYRLSDEDAAAIAHTADSTLKLLRHAASRGSKSLAGVEPAFGYDIVVAEARRLRRRG